MTIHVLRCLNPLRPRFFLFRCPSIALTSCNRYLSSGLLPLSGTKSCSQIKLISSIIRRGAATKKTVPLKIKPSEFRRLLDLAKKEKWVIAAGIGCLIVSSAITMTVPFGLGKILDLIYSKSGNGDDQLSEFCLLLLGIFILGGAANFTRVYLFSNASLRITNRLRSRLYRALLSQEAAWFDTKGTGELVSRLSADCALVGNSLSQNVSDGLRNIVMVLAGSGMMIYTSPKLALLGVCIVPCIAGFAVSYGRYVRKITKELTDIYADVMKTAEERLSNVKTVKMFSKEEHEIQMYSKQLFEALRVGYQESKARATFYGLTGLSGNVIIVSVLYYGANLVASNEITVGTLTSFLLYAAYTAISIGGLSSFYSELNKSIGSASRIWEIMDREYSIPIKGGYIHDGPIRGAISFQDITFSYPNRPDVRVLNQFSLALQPNTSTAIVGRSGSGKSTIAALLLRLYDPQGGGILLDGRNLTEYDPSWVRRNIGTVNQEPVLFSGTIRENILYGLDENQQVSEGELNIVIREAQIDEFIRQLPAGLDTLVGQRGMMLSGGQKQRIALARALIKKPAILILDEATSSLDTVSEELIRRALANLSGGHTILSIAHRLSTILSADQIAVLENGQVVEVGGYKELMQLPNGIFKELVQHQTFTIDQ